MAAMAVGAGGMAPPLTSPVVSTVTTHTFPADRDRQRQRLGQICPASPIQMGDAKTHRWMMPKHG
jgi:hypothetical protein